MVQIFFPSGKIFLQMVFKQNVKRNNKFDMHLKGAFKPKKKEFFMGDWALLARHIFEIWSFNNMC